MQDTELEVAIDAVIEWLDFDVWDGNDALQDDVKKLKHARLQQILNDRANRIGNTNG